MLSIESCLQQKPTSEILKPREEDDVVIYNNYDNFILFFHKYNCSVELDSEER